LNASDARGIKVVRETIKSFAETRAPIKSNFNCKIVILDEADSMTRDAQAALRRIMEKYSASTRFCLICNYVRIKFNIARSTK
jgi:DNA polymerase III delta prime subunit